MIGRSLHMADKTARAHVTYAICSIQFVKNNRKTSSNFCVYFTVSGRRKVGAYRDSDTD